MFIGTCSVTTTLVSAFTKSDNRTKVEFSFHLLEPHIGSSFWRSYVLPDMRLAALLPFPARPPPERDWACSAEGQKVASGELEPAAVTVAVDEGADADSINIHSIELSGNLPDGAEVADFFMNS